MMTDKISGAITLLQRGVKLDEEKRYTEALVHYQEGLQLLIDSMKCISDPSKKKYIHEKVDEYMSRAENLKQFVKKKKEEGKYHEQIKIENDSIGHSYHNVFGRFLNDEVEEIKVEDPYVRSFHQCQNFLRFCELAVKLCQNLEKIILITSKDASQSKIQQEQETHLTKINTSLCYHKITLVLDYSSTLHDRQISLSSGWIIKIGRGLDYFKAPDNNLSIGSCDMDLRKCHETIVDVFHSSAVRLS